ncbi:response regulator transcription factor [Methylocapsa sp. S129]|uniref:response regulator transcription factor n=1 Tax=Methylocapsa sp. S129 TaxID=1641869 RepID=UPI00131C41E4|nr:response regulator transcription factor [Methylocapsa sp. S129]
MSFEGAIKHPPVLLIEDEKGLVDEISAELRGLGYPVSHADTIEGGLRAARDGDAAIMIADRLLHGSDGVSMIQTLRAEGVTTPVLVISTLSSVDERIRVLKAGGDDYLVKPFAMAELVARVEVMARRLGDAPTIKLRAGSLEMDLIEQTVRRGKTLINLLPTEFKLLEYFMQHPGQIVTRAMLLEEVWRHRVGPQTNVIDVHIGKLRRKIDARGKPSLIRNIRGAGFKLNADG